MNRPKQIAFIVLLILLAFVPAAVVAQTAQPQYQPSESGVPMVTGFVGFGTEFQPGQQQLLQTYSPIFLVPFGDRWLIESEIEIEGSYAHQNGMPWEHDWAKGIEYAQMDFFANRYLTLVGGRFLTPFGIFNERLHPGWVRNIQTAPYITNFEMTDSNGGMARGGIAFGDKLNINYAAFYSAPASPSWFQATRATGTRIGFFFLKARLELGGSYQKDLGGDHSDNYGVDWIWQSTKLPLDIRGEYAHNHVVGSGYWLEGAYRMRKMPFWRPFMRKSQAELRMEQFFVPAMSMGGGGGMGGVPDKDAKRFFAGWSYWIHPQVRATFAVGREFSADGDHNVFTVGLTYRFAFPLMGGKK